MQGASIARKARTRAHIQIPWCYNGYLEPHKKKWNIHLNDEGRVYMQGIGAKDEQNKRTAAGGKAVESVEGAMGKREQEQK